MLPEVVTIGVFSILFGAVAVIRRFHVVERRNARRALRATPELDAQSREGETVHVTGIVRVAEDTVAAPLSGRTCVVARARIVANKPGDPNAHTTGTPPRSEETVRMVPFLIDRGPAGIVRVEGNHAVLDLPQERLANGSTDRERQLQFRALHGFPSSYNARFEETVVEPGTRISVSGMIMKDVAEQQPTSELGFREPLPMTIRLAGNAEHPLAIGTPID